MSSQPPMGGHLAIPQNDILYRNVSPMSSHLRLKATFPVSQVWLLIAGSTVYDKSHPLEYDRKQQIMCFFCKEKLNNFRVQY